MTAATREWQDAQYRICINLEQQPDEYELGEIDIEMDVNSVYSTNDNWEIEEQAEDCWTIDLYEGWNEHNEKLEASSIKESIEASNNGCIVNVEVITINI